ncbi:hypothetical protein [Geofilum rhodophaeum]|uniref:hypothetical protein n=1 Tax=Geofilum rhodophaeum TaxID=1965019 RepID=UPI000B52803B|nr:hypothetical protein [Geofilum rhodophaeum]
MKHIIILTLLNFSLNGNAQSLIDSIILFDNYSLQSCKNYENIFQCNISPFSDGQNPIFRDERDFNIKATLFAENGKEIELPQRPDKLKLEVFADSIKVYPLLNTIEINGYVTGGWYGAGSHVHVYLGQKVDTIMNITLSPNLHGPTYYNDKKVKEPIVITTLPAIKLENYIHIKSEVGFENHPKRAFRISGQFNNKSILAFGLSSSYVEIFEIGELLTKTE